MALNVGSSPFLQSVSSMDRYGYEGLPPELAAEEQAINRRQQMANYLMQQGLHPAQGQMAGRFYVPASPVQGLAGLAQVFAGQMMGDRADESRQKISKDSKNMLAQAMQQYKEASDPVTREGPRPTSQVMPPPPSTDPHAGLMPQPPAQPVPVELPGPGAPVQVPRSPDERRKAMVEQLLLNQHPQAQAVGKLLIGELDRSQAREDQQAFLAGESRMNREARSADAKMQLDAMVANKLITQEQANTLLGQNQRLHDERMAAEKDRDRQNAVRLKGMDAGSKEKVAGINAGQKGQLPSAALKMQQEGLDAIGLASSLNADLKALDEQVSSGKLQLGMVNNLVGTARNYAGLSNEQSRNLSTFKATLEKQRNDSLRLNKGVQTEGDAVRAWNELIANINDPALVSQRLKEISAINERAANLRKLEVDVIRKNYGLDPMEMSGFTEQPAAVGSGQGAAPYPGKSNAGLSKTNAKGWTLHQDAKGNKAYVGPNGEIEEVR